MPYETWIVPTSHAPRPAEAERWARRSGTLPGGWGPCSATAWRGTRCCTTGRPAGGTFHWHVELLPRLTVAAAVELGAGIWVNVVDPVDRRRRAAGYRIAVRGYGQEAMRESAARRVWNSRAAAIAAPRLRPLSLACLISITSSTASMS